MNPWPALLVTALSFAVAVVAPVIVEIIDMRLRKRRGEYDGYRFD